MMETKNEYKMTEFGKIPYDWEVFDFSELVDAIDGDRGKNYPSPDDFEDKGYCVFLNTGNVKKTGFNFDEIKYISKEKHLSLRTGTLQRGDIVLTSRGTIGNVALYDDSVEFNNIRINSAMLILRKKVHNLDYKYFMYFLRGKTIEEFIRKSKVGSAQPHITKASLIKEKIIVPPLREQEKIAEILSDVDKQIEQTDQLIEKTKELKKGLMQELLTKGIGHTEFKNSALGEIPVEWEVKSLGEVSTIINGGTPSKNNSEYWDNGNILWATPTDITKNKSKYIENTNLKISEKGLKKSSASLLPKGSILMTSRATIGEKSINLKPMATNQGFKSFICTDSLFNEYLYYYIDLLKPLFLKKASGSTFLEISKKATEAQMISLPSLDEQQKIASILSSVDEDIEGYEEEKAQYEELKNGLMQQLLTGKIRVKVD